jgi:hypothetical protein
MLHLGCEANSSSKRRREPERTSRMPKPDATTDEQTQRPDPSLADRPGRTYRPYRLSPPGHRRRRRGRRCGALDRVPGGQPTAFAPRRVRGTHRHANELRSVTSAAARLMLKRSIIASPSLLIPLGMRISERRALLKRVSHAAQHRCQLRGAQSSAARNRVFPTARLAAGPGRSTASESIASAILAPASRPPRSGFARASCTRSPAHRRSDRFPVRPPRQTLARESCLGAASASFGLCLAVDREHGSAARRGRRAR